MIRVRHQWIVRLRRPRGEAVAELDHEYEYGEGEGQNCLSI